MKIIGVRHIPREQFEAQGTLANVLRRYKKDGFSVTKHGKGNGNWLIYKKTQLLLDVEEDGEIISIDITQEVRNIYDRQSITKRLIQQLQEDIESGKLSLEDF
ncbi:hypothetical protein JEQ21_08450 [Streptococcus sp. 121]|uniref:hypothetical protein n=1 Tax=Streptococcus sp. 121 TaxID=2797637 RepID=UPI0018F1020D|nr:hypothetical protein [Streptococcus sp. 121]MBJ6746477.1 hypothetical protein [Streptococcus sp. 121]